MMDSGYTARRRRGDAQTSGERLKVHLWKVSGDGQTDGCLNCQKKKRRGETEKPPCQLPVCHRAREVVCSVTQSLISAQWEVVISSGSEPCALSKYPLGG